MSGQLIRVLWTDGSETTGKSWQSLEQAIRSQQWHKYPTRTAFRRDMRHRAKVWSGVRPDIVTASARDFIEALEASGLCRIELESVK